MKILRSSISDTFSVLKNNKSLFLRNAVKRIVQDSDKVCLRRILNMLDRLEIKFTFFIVGFLAETYPDFIKEIAHRGHEIASHGYVHRAYGNMSPQEIEDDLRKSIQAFNSLGIDIMGIRPPYLSHHGKLDSIADKLGFQYNSGSVAFEFCLYENVFSGAHAAESSPAPLQLPITQLSDYDLIEYKKLSIEDAIEYWKKESTGQGTYLFHSRIIGSDRHYNLMEDFFRYLKDEFRLVTMNEKASGKSGIALTMDIGVLNKRDLFHLLLN